MSGKITSGGFGLKIEAGAARQLSKKFKEAGSDFSDLKAANATAAGIVKNESVRRVPRRSSSLANSIRSSGTKTAGTVRAGKASVPYARVIHWGTLRAKTDFWKARKIQPSLFATKAAKDTEPEWGAVYAGLVQKALDRITKG